MVVLADAEAWYIHAASPAVVDGGQPAWVIGTAVSLRVHLLDGRTADLTTGEARNLVKNGWTSKPCQ